jgi:solute carrier family 35 protein C2
MTASEFALLQRTSVVTLSIAGIFKEVVTILAAGRVFSDIMTPVNLGGLAITIAAIAGYNYVKIMKMRQEALATAHLANLGVQGRHEPLATSGDDEEDEGYGMGQREQGKAQESQGLLAQGSGAH